MSEVSPPTEEVVKALLDYLVDPMLPLKASRKSPPLSDQKSVAKQMHAVVLLYNYYHRKLHPEARFLEYGPFCQLALNLKPVLIAHMNSVHQSEKSRDLGNQLSLTEKAIMDACNISLSLERLTDVKNVEEWPIRKVSVLLIDSKKENCLLLYDATTNGVWSVIEEFLDVPDLDLEFSLEAIALDKMRQSKMTPADENEAKGSDFEQVAFSAVEKATGIHKSELMVLERHVVYSLSKDKTAACFYIMNCSQSCNDFEVPIRDAIESLQGPLLRWSSGCWTQTQVVEYYNVLPYAMAMSSWYMREVISNGSASGDVSSFGKDYKNRSEEFAESSLAISNDSQNSSTRFQNIVDNKSMMLGNTCEEKFSKFADFSDPSYNDVKSSGTENIADRMYNIVEEEAKEMENSSESITEGNPLKLAKEAKEMVISDQSCGVTHPILDKMATSIDAECSGKESVVSEDFGLGAMETGINNNAPKPLGIKSESCNDATRTTKEKLNSEKLIDKLDSENIADKMSNIVEKEAKEIENSSEPINEGNPLKVAKETQEMLTSDLSHGITHQFPERMGNSIDAECSGKESIVTDDFESGVLESEKYNNAQKPLEITQPVGKGSENCNNAPGTSKEKLDSDNFEMVEINIKEKQKPNDSFNITYPTAGQLEIGVSYELNSDTVENNRVEKEVERSDSSSKLLDINHSAVKHLENDVYFYIGEGTNCAAKSTTMEIEVEDINRYETCPRINNSSFEELGNSVHVKSSGKKSSGHSSEKTQKLVEETEKCYICCDAVKLHVKKLSSNDLAHSKQCTSHDLQIIGYPPEKRQKMDKDGLMDILQNRHKRENAEVPNRVYLYRKQKTLLDSGASSSVAGTSLYVETAGSPKSLSGNFRKENVAESSFIVEDGGLASIIAEKEQELTQTALSVLYSKRAKLCNQKRIIQDEVALCDRNIQRILEGNLDAFASKLEAVIEGCKLMLGRED